MARINIEDSFVSDPRFRAVVRKVEDEDRALGMAARMFRLGQKYWGDGKSLVPRKLFALEGLDIFIEADLAEEREQGVYVRGSEKQFEWYANRMEAAKLGGQKSAAARKSRSGTSIPENARNRVTEANTEAKSNQNPTKRRSKTEAPTEASLLLTPSSLLSSPCSIESPPERTGSSTAVEIVSPVARDKKPGEEFIALYCDTYRARYNARPAISGRDAGIAKRLIGTQGLPASLALVRAYLAMDDSWFVTKHHDLPTLEENLNKVAVHLQTGGTGPPPKETWIERRKREALERETKEQELKNAQ